MQVPWLFSRKIDVGFLLIPVWLCWLVCFLLPESVLQSEVPLWVWVVFILGIDVGHVWSTIFRTYLDQQEFQMHKRLLLITPIICLTIATLVATNSVTLFWTLLAYMALFHFVKQQFGFMQLYRAKFGFIKFNKVINDKFIIYWSMLYPVLYWHINTTRNFNWFIEGDFINLRSTLEMIPFWDQNFHELFTTICNSIYFSLIVLWLIEDYRCHVRKKSVLPVGKWLWVLTTCGNWYIGIVYFNSDLAFSLTNVIAHGIPYLVLIFFYVEKKKQLKTSAVTTFRVARNIAWMLLLVLLLAFGEEYFWDMLIYRDNETFFESILSYPFNVLNDPIVQGFALALLSVPQVTHYILDGFIWKTNARNPYVRKTLLT